MIDFIEVDFESDELRQSARGFISARGFHNESTIDRGLDQGKDMRVTEKRSDNLGSCHFCSFVSSQRFTESDKLFSEDDEPSIVERCAYHRSDGFVGFYSTLALSGLNSRIKALRDNRKTNDYSVMDGRLVENVNITLVLPTPASDNVAEYIPGHCPMKFISEPIDLQPEDCMSDAFCAYGDNTRLESRSVESRMLNNAGEFAPDGNHFVVFASLQPGIANEDCIVDAVFVRAPKTKYHGLFEPGLCNDIVGMFSLPVFQQLGGMSVPNRGKRLAVLFPNRIATEMLTNEFVSTLPRVCSTEPPSGAIKQMALSSDDGGGRR